MSDLSRVSSLLALAEDASWPERVVIRQLEVDDLPEVEWEGEYSRFRNIYHETFWRMKNGLAIMWVAALPPAGLAGQVFVQFETSNRELADGKRRAYVHSFRVREAFRGCGVGARLMAHAEKDLAGRGFQEVSLNVTRENEGALRLYKRLGYEVIGEDPGKWVYYDERNVLRNVHEPGWRMLKNFAE